MEIRYVIEITEPNGLTETKQELFNKSSIVIGRGGSSDVILDNHIVALEHAKFEIQGDALTVSDLGSHSGTTVNGRPQKFYKLRNNDNVKLGDVELLVKEDGKNWILLEKRVKQKEEKRAERIERIAASLDVRNHLPSLLFLAVFAAFAVVVVWGYLPATGVNVSQWSSGPISKKHGMISQDCGACHGAVLERVNDNKCLSCHNLSEHSEVLPKLIQAGSAQHTNCVSCHQEHNGDGHLIIDDGRLCNSCHADLKKVHPDTKLPNVSSFAEHPEFRIELHSANAVTRVSLADKANVADPTPLKLNHKLHLKDGIRGPNGDVTLSCNDCHKLSKDFSTLEPITFESNCKSCHPLGFDDRLPGNEVPHGNPDVVYNYIYAEYAKLFLAGTDEIPRPEELNIRSRPGYEDKRDRDEAIAFTKDNIVDQARKSEEQLFTRTACYMCHEIAEESHDAKEKLSKFSVSKVQIPSHWLAAARFGHGSHEEISCESCHADVRQSEKSKDVNIPGKAFCTDCHSSGHVEGKVNSECMTCHSYHDSMPMADAKKKKLKLG